MLAITSPVWGVLGDRLGRKPMLIRSMIGAGISIALIFFVRHPIELVALRLLQGSTSGTFAAATALVAAETPRERVGWALGLLNSSLALGSAMGPAVGGLAASHFGLRISFLAGGVLMLVSTVPVAVLVRESPRREPDGRRVGVVEMIRARPGTQRALTFLIIAQGLLYSVTTGSQQLVVLKLLGGLGSVRASTITGIAFGISGLATSLAAAGYTRVTRRVGYLATAIGAATLLAVAVGVEAVAPWVVLLVVAVGLAGLVAGALGPATASMIGLEAPSNAMSTVFGINTSAVALGLFAGPVIGGGVAAIGGVNTGLAVTAGVALVLAVLLFGAREPAR